MAAVAPEHEDFLTGFWIGATDLQDTLIMGIWVFVCGKLSFIFVSYLMFYSCVIGVNSDVMLMNLTD